MLFEVYRYAHAIYIYIYIYVYILLFSDQEEIRESESFRNFKQNVKFKDVGAKQDYA